MAEPENNTLERDNEHQERAAAEHAAERLKVLQKKAAEDAKKAQQDTDELLKRAQRNYREEAAQAPQYTDWDTPQQAEPTATASPQKTAKPNQATISNPTIEYYPSTSTRFKAEQQQRVTDPRQEPDEKTAEKKQQKQQQAQQREERASEREQTNYLQRTQRQLTTKAKRQILSKARKGLGPTAKASARARARAVTLIASMIIGVVYIIQFWAALVWYAGFGLAVAAQGTFLGWLVKNAYDIVTGILNVFDRMGGGLGAYELLLALASIAQVVILVQGLILIAIVAIMFKLADVHAFSGKLASFKWILFIVMIIGYTIPLPIINLIPWIIPWMLFVSWFPR